MCNEAEASGLPKDNDVSTYPGVTIGDRRLCPMSLIEFALLTVHIRYFDLLVPFTMITCTSPAVSTRFILRKFEPAA